MNLRSLMPIGRDRNVARSDNAFMSLQREIDRLFDDFTRGFSAFSTGGAAELLPNLDVTETDKQIEITAELPGLEEKDVQVNLADNVLRSAARKRRKRKRRIRPTGWSSAAMVHSCARSNCRKESMPMPSRPVSTKACSR
jgi:HSP20 family protein